MSIPLTVTAGFGEIRPNHFHSGIDFSTAGKNQAVLAIEKGWNDVFKPSPSRSNSFIKGFQILVTFHIVCALWVFFKAETFQQASVLFSQIINSFDFKTIPAFVLNYQLTLGILAAALFLHALPLSLNDRAIGLLSKLHWTIKAVILTLVLLLISYFNQAGQVMPIYLQF